MPDINHNCLKSLLDNIVIFHVSHGKGAEYPSPLWSIQHVIDARRLIEFSRGSNSIPG
jgi:hypothetical protein